MPAGSPTDRLAALRERRRQLAVDTEAAGRELDELLVDMWEQRTLSVTQIATTLGLSRQEVHRRMRRARGRAEQTGRRLR